MTSSAKPDVTQAIASVYRTDWGRIIAILIRLVGDFDIAEEAAQEAFAAAVNQWQSAGIPDRVHLAIGGVQKIVQPDPKHNEKRELFSAPLEI